MQFESCNISDKNKSCCSSSGTDSEEFSYENHWDSVYAKSAAEKLGWYETDFTPAFSLISKTSLGCDARILNVGAGNTFLVDELIKNGYTNLAATDISRNALVQLEERVGASTGVDFIVDDLTEPTVLHDTPEVDLWIDRAVLHFFTLEDEQNTYFDLLRSKVKKGGYALLAQFHTDGARTCSGLPVKRYDSHMLSEKIGPEFRLVDHFIYNYTMPSGDTRPYIYALFVKP
jgi:hypothetical protein